MSPSTDMQPAECRGEQADDRENVEGTRATRDVVHEQHGEGDDEHRGYVQPPEPDVPDIALTAREHYQAEGERDARSDDMSCSEVQESPVAVMRLGSTTRTVRRIELRLIETTHVRGRFEVS